MNTAGIEWAAKVAARNAVETAKAARTETRTRMEQQTFDWTGGGAAIRLLPLSAEGADGKAVK